MHDCNKLDPRVRRLQIGKNGKAKWAVVLTLDDLANFPGAPSKSSIYKRLLGYGGKHYKVEDAVCPRGPTGRKVAATV